jgi:hypothetical protein
VRDTVSDGLSVKPAVELLVVEPSAGPLVTSTVGATVSTVQLRVAGVVSTFPDGSTPRTYRVHRPFAVRLLKVASDEQLPKLPVPPGGSSRHWKVESGSLGALSENVALVLLVLEP